MNDATTIRLLNAEEVAKILNVKVRSVYLLIRSKQLKTLRIGKHYRFREQDLQKFIESGITKGEKA